MPNIHPSTNAPHGARTVDLPIPRRTPYPLGHGDRKGSPWRSEYGVRLAAWRSRVCSPLWERSLDPPIDIVYWF
ncbi:hypothetical protein DPMN_070082 [Dreissena polymorpha]|uniref:Uncharacterized protein n=1 Tax=Dreissena polymorpha TaxID=45954 RepID=A0A9D3Z0B9_DREPO|nr:hypothetical protein DPMN_070082 [Dreissena polymorpha]